MANWRYPVGRKLSNTAFTECSAFNTDKDRFNTVTGVTFCSPFVTMDLCILKVFISYMLISCMLCSVISSTCVRPCFAVGNSINIV